MKVIDENQTESQADAPPLVDLKKDIERHRVMLGHPPTGPIYQWPSDEEVQARIARSKERLEQFNQRLMER